MVPTTSSVSSTSGIRIIAWIFQRRQPRKERAGRVGSRFRSAPKKKWVFRVRNSSGAFGWLLSEYLPGLGETNNPPHLGIELNSCGSLQVWLRQRDNEYAATLRQPTVLKLLFQFGTKPICFGEHRHFCLGYQTINTTNNILPVGGSSPRRQ